KAHCVETARRFDDLAAADGIGKDRIFEDRAHESARRGRVLYDEDLLHGHPKDTRTESHEVAVCFCAMPRTAAAVVIGNEILSGKVQEANVFVLAKVLRDLGIALRRVVAILDEVDAIAREVRELAGAHDWLFTSGGVGPTHDDVTIEAVAKAFGVPVVTNP